MSDTGSGVCNAAALFVRDALTDPRIQCPFPQCSASHTVNASKNGSEEDEDDPEEHCSVTWWKTSGREERAGRKLIGKDYGEREEIGDFLSIFL
jgi:hypothetical protein